MEMKEEYYDEIFTTHHQPFFINTATNQLQLEYPLPTWNSCAMQQTITSTTPSSSASARQLIYVENKNGPVPVLEESSLVSVDIAASSFHDQLLMNPNYGLSANLSSNTVLDFSSPVLKDDSVMNYNMRNLQYDGSVGTNGGNSWNRVNCGSVPVRSRLQAREHLVAERKRREKLGQLFINLSKLVPGIKKLDKASILEDAIDYIKILEERIRSLEKEQAKKCSEDRHNSYSLRKISSNIDGSTNELSAVSAIEVKILNRSVLIKILCKKKIKGLMSRIHMEMEKMNLCEVDIRVMPFESNAIDITILAQMQSDDVPCSSTVKEIVEQLEMAFLNQVAT